jgi:sugar phosphate isomerase/epimerase
MRIGATSYTYPADILTNVRKLAGSVQDIELVLFEAAEDGSDLPQQAEIQELIRLAGEYDFTYTVHLPLDLELAGPAPSLSRALKVVRTTLPLSPAAFIIHLDSNDPEQGVKNWLCNSASALEALHDLIGDWDRICVENLETQPTDMMDAILSETHAAACIDVGHLWKQGISEVSKIQAWIGRARVVHLHGVGKRDHKSLSLMPEALLDPVVALIDRRFDGILTLEVFNKADLRDSRNAFDAALLRTRSWDWTG